jgi:hypothetical protein
MWDDGNSVGPREIHAYLTRVMYSRRNKFDPLWNSLVLGGVKKGQRSMGLNWDALNINPVCLTHLDNPFSIEELKKAVFGLNSEKAPGPDGFTGLFFKKCWDVIHLDLLEAVNQAFAFQGRQWNLLNSANITLIPKGSDAANATDYRPISLMHSFAKIFGKLLATRLAPELCKMISPSQSAFIKRRSIHDNFVYVKGVIKDAQFKNNPLLFLKLDFSKAFDSTHWDYCLRPCRLLILENNGEKLSL